MIRHSHPGLLGNLFILSRKEYGGHLFKNGHLLCKLAREASPLEEEQMEMAAIECFQHSGEAGLMNGRDDRQKRHLRQWLAPVNKLETVNYR